MKTKWWMIWHSKPPTISRYDLFLAAVTCGLLAAGQSGADSIAARSKEYADALEKVAEQEGRRNASA